jgi:hypothetical protein
MSGLSSYSATEILAELQRRIHCRQKAESRTILVGPPGKPMQVQVRKSCMQAPAHYHACRSQ